ncbi:Uncharacterised protein [[Flavobacterium] thermophilum]|nr:hypothetical protein GARCT_00208 [Geobacillus sp. 12AMOR1]WJQ14246.1 hypothetical protein QT238_01015 [Geobacillus stearothermophilus]STO35725.1 Uncharacterised protein [[Flavobacterium] thermophilum]
MEIINVNGININIKDSVKIQDENGVMFVTDAEISSEQFNDFLDLYHKYSRKGEYFNVVINKKGFYGRFGQLVYSEGVESYKLRLVFVESKLDTVEQATPRFIVDDAEYQNIKDKIAKQELIIDKLINTLVNKEILDENAANLLKTFNQEELKRIKFEMATKVEDLDKYLESINDRLSDIRKQQRI